MRDEGPGIPADRVERVFDRFGSGGDSPAAPGSAWPSRAGSASCTAASITALPTTPGATGALLRAVLPRAPAPAGPPTSMEESAVTAPAPTAGTHAGAARRRTGAATGTAPAGLPGARPGVPGPVRRALDGFWPEQGVPVQPLTVLAALGIGAWAALTWPERNVGLAVALTLLAAGLLMWLVARYRRNPWTSRAPCSRRCSRRRRCSATPVAWWRWPCSSGSSSRPPAPPGPAPCCRCRSVSWPGRCPRLRGLPLLGRTITATSRVSKLWPILRTVGLSLVALALFGGLFASGDALFGSWAEALVPDLGWDTIVARTFVLVLVAGVALTGAYLALNPPPVADVALPESRRTTHRWEWAVPVGIVVALFAGFLVAQATAMWGGHEYLERTTGLTYAEYVHQGFGQLTVATFLTVVVVGLDDAGRAARHVARPAAAAGAARRPVRAHPGRRGERAVPDVAVPGRLRLHRAAGLRRRLRAVARPRGGVPARRRRAAVGVVGAARGARLGRGLRAGVRRDEPRRLGGLAQHRPVRGGQELDTAYLSDPQRRRDPGHRRAAACRPGPCITREGRATPFETDDWLAWNLGRSRAARPTRDTLGAARLPGERLPRRPARRRDRRLPADPLACAAYTTPRKPRRRDAPDGILPVMDDRTVLVLNGPEPQPAR